MEPRPNILVIMSDEHAPMYSHAYGHPRIETPHMDALAAGGTLFRDGVLPVPALRALPRGVRRRGSTCTASGPGTTGPPSRPRR